MPWPASLVVLLVLLAGNLADAAVLVGQSSLCTEDEGYSNVKISVRQGGDFDSVGEYTTLTARKSRTETTIATCITEQNDWSGGTCETPIEVNDNFIVNNILTASLRSASSVGSGWFGSGAHTTPNSAAIMLVSYTCKVAERSGSNGVIVVSGKDHIEKNNRFPEIKFDFEFPGWGNGAGCTAQVDLDQHGDLETTSDEYTKLKYASTDKDGVANTKLIRNKCLGGGEPRQCQGLGVTSFVFPLTPAAATTTTTITTLTTPTTTTAATELCGCDHCYDGDTHEQGTCKEYENGDYEGDDGCVNQEATRWCSTDGEAVAKDRSNKCTVRSCTTSGDANEELVVGATLRNEKVYFEVCAPCSATPKIEYASSGSSNYESFYGEDALDCSDGKWKEQGGWSVGNAKYTIRVTVDSQSVVTDENAALKVGELHCVPSTAITTTTATEPDDIDVLCTGCSDMSSGHCKAVVCGENPDREGCDREAPLCVAATESGQCPTHPYYKEKGIKYEFCVSTTANASTTTTAAAGTQDADDENLLCTGCSLGNGPCVFENEEGHRFCRPGVGGGTAVCEDGFTRCADTLTTMCTGCKYDTSGPCKASVTIDNMLFPDCVAAAESGQCPVHPLGQLSAIYTYEFCVSTTAVTGTTATATSKEDPGAPTTADTGATTTDTATPMTNEEGEDVTATSPLATTVTTTTVTTATATTATATTTTVTAKTTAGITLMVRGTSSVATLTARMVVSYQCTAFNPDNCEVSTKCADTDKNDCCAHDDWKEDAACTDGWVPVVTGDCSEKGNAKFKCCEPVSTSSTTTTAVTSATTTTTTSATTKPTTSTTTTTTTTTTATTATATTTTTTTKTTATATTTTTATASTTTTTTTVYDPGNVDCVEVQDACTTDCQSAAERHYRVLTPANKKGKACFGGTDCVPGEQACPTTSTTTTTTTTTKTTATATTATTATASTTTTTTTVYDRGNVDCVEVQDACTTDCQSAAERHYRVLTPANKKGKACFGGTDCVPGEQACPTTSTTTTTTTKTTTVKTTSTMHADAISDGGLCPSSQQCASGLCRGKKCCGKKGKGAGCTACDYDGDCASCSPGYVLKSHACVLNNVDADGTTTVATAAVTTARTASVQPGQGTTAKLAQNTTSSNTTDGSSSSAEASNQADGDGDGDGDAGADASSDVDAADDAGVEGGGMSDAAIAGISVGIVVVLVFLAAVVWWRRQTQDNAPMPPHRPSLMVHNKAFSPTPTPTSARNSSNLARKVDKKQKQKQTQKQQQKSGGSARREAAAKSGRRHTTTAAPAEFSATSGTTGVGRTVSLYEEPVASQAVEYDAVNENDAWDAEYASVEQGVVSARTSAAKAGKKGSQTGSTSADYVNIAIGSKAEAEAPFYVNTADNSMAGEEKYETIGKYAGFGDALHAMGGEMDDDSKYETLNPGAGLNLGRAMMQMEEDDGKYATLGKFDDLSLNAETNVDEAYC